MYSTPGLPNLLKESFLTMSKRVLHQTETRKLHTEFNKWLWLVCDWHISKRKVTQEHQEVLGLIDMTDAKLCFLDGVHFTEYQI